MMTDCRPIFADERSASRAVFCHAIIPLKHRPFLTSGAANVAGHATAPHALERALGFRVKMRKHICINIPSGGCQLHQHSIWGMPVKIGKLENWRFPILDSARCSNKPLLGLKRIINELVMLDFTSQESFDTVHGFCNAVSQEMEMVQLDKGKLKIEETKRELNEFLSLHRIKNNRKIVVKRDVCKNKIRFNLPNSKKIVSGKELNNSNMSVYEPDRDYCAILPSDNDTIEVEIDYKFLKKNNAFICDQIKNSSGKIFTCESTRYLREIFLAILYQNPNHERYDAYNSNLCQDIVLPILDQVIINNIDYKEPDSTDIKGGKNWSLFKDIIQNISNEQKDNYNNVNDISIKFNIEQRNLFNIFKKYTGISPSQYILAYKLCVAQSSLYRERHFDDPVTRAAVDAEIFHLGRFSQYYKSFFGHLPSEAIRRAREEQF